MWKCRWNIRWRKMWAFFRLNVCIGFRVSSTFGQSDGCMSDTPETMGGLSGVPNGTSSQTSASRGYVLFRGAIRDTHKSPTNCLPGYGHDPRSAPNLEKHGSSKMQTFGWLEMPHFLNRMSICIFIWNPMVWSSYNITYQSNARYAYCVCHGSSPCSCISRATFTYSRLLR